MNLVKAERQMLNHCQAFLTSTVEGDLGSCPYWLDFMCQHLEGALGSPGSTRGTTEKCMERGGLEQA